MDICLSLLSVTIFPKKVSFIIAVDGMYLNSIAGSVSTSIKRFQWKVKREGSSKRETCL